MLVFIIPLKSQQVSKSWDRVSKLFERCIKSVCNQTSPNFRVIVVCHEKPQIEFSHPHITYIEVDFPAPNSEYKNKRLDRKRKVIVGLNYARQLKPSHIMKVDADDCVSKYLAELVEQNPQSNGWFVNKGYLYQDGSKFVYFKRKDFYKWCGSCNIIAWKLLNVPESLLPDTIELKKYYWGHRKVVEKLAQQGTPIQPLPFAGAIYLVGHGDNTYPYSTNFLSYKGVYFWLKQILFNFRLLTSSVRNEFGLYDIR